MFIEIVDDNIQLTRHLKKSFIRQWYWVKVYNTRDDFVHNSDFSADLFLMDINLWDGNGLDLIEKIRISKNVTAPIIVISWQTKTGTRKDSFVIWADDFLEKPFTINDLNSRIDDIFSHIESKTVKECWYSHKVPYCCLSDSEKEKIFIKKDIN